MQCNDDRLSKKSRIVGESIKKIISETLQIGTLKDFDDRFRHLTVTRVLVAADKRSAKIYVSSPIFEIKNKKCFPDFLNKHASQFRSAILKKLRIRFCPELFFRYDVDADLVISDKEESESFSVSDFDIK